MGEHKFLLRVPEPLWVELRAAARLSRRSVNSEILFRLGQQLDPVGVPVVADGRVPLGEMELRHGGRVVARVVDRPFRPDFKGG